MPENTVGSLKFNQVTTTSVETTKLVEYEIYTDPTNPNRIVIDTYMSLGDAVAQVSTITITAALASVGNDYVVGVSFPGNTARTGSTYRHKMQSGETPATVAKFLAQLINSDSDLVATATANVITVTSSNPGEEFTLVNTGSSTPADVAVATPVAASGDMVHRKIAESAFNFSVNAQGYIVLLADGRFFNGALSQAVLQAFGPVTVATAPRALGQIINEQT